ncbi:MAG: agmatine deiminase [Halieaceae bacterium]|jgi:agmatine deiminase
MTDQFYMPAEWDLHERCWMAWPCRKGMWADDGAIQRNYAAVAHAIREFEPVTMVAPAHLMQNARDCLGVDVDLLEMPIDDSWTRDSGPNFVVDGKGGIAGVTYGFNAWGEKYSPYDQDALMAQRILEQASVRRIDSPLIAEGGSLCVDGEGTLLTTDTCFPHINRNPDWSQDDIEAELMRTLGVEKVIWLPGDPEDDETDGHVDGIATFVRPGVVLVESSADPADPRRPYYEKLRACLEQSTDARGRQFELINLPEARDVDAMGDKFCRSYVNLYFANGGIIAPSYGIATDDEVRECLQDVFPDRQISMVNICQIAEGGGGIHCITQQQPKT